MGNPRRALEEMALLKQHLTTPDYHQYMYNYLEDQQAKDSGPVITNRLGQPDGRAFCTRTIAGLEVSEVFYVGSDMMPLVEWAANGLNGTDKFARDLWPSDYGFCYFNDGHLADEIWGRTVVKKAFTWSRFYDERTKSSGMFLVYYTDVNDPRDEVNGFLREQAGSPEEWDRRVRGIGHLEVNHITVIWDDMRVGPEVLEPPEDYMAWVNRRYGADRLAEIESRQGALTVTRTTNDSRFLLALLMMFNQTVVSRTTERPDRPTAKRMRRMNLPGDVTVIRLRRISGVTREEGESVVEWAHRWICTGHWRNQPTRDGIKRIWIAPYVKGPADKPFKQTTKVRALVR